MRISVIATLAALALAGCGSGGGGGDYAQQLTSALASVSQPASLDAASLDRLASDYSHVADRLGSLTPPPAVAGAHAQMVSEMRAYADELAQASRLTANASAFAIEMSRAETDAHAWTAAFQQIQAAGYATVSSS